MTNKQWLTKDGTPATRLWNKACSFDSSSWRLLVLSERNTDVVRGQHSDARMGALVFGHVGRFCAREAAASFIQGV